MPDLIAQGPRNENRWRRELPSASSGVQILLGRSGADWNVPWDKQISKSHVRLSSESGDRVAVSCLATARNPVFHQGKKVLRCTLVPGDHFVIGKTTFTLANRPGVSDQPLGGDVTEHLYDHAALRRGSFRDAGSRIEVLGRLPDLITRSGSDEELLVRVTSVLLQATPSASAVAIAAIDGEPDTAGGGKLRILHYDSRELDAHGIRNEDPPVSARLVASAVHCRESVLHLWSGHRDSDAPMFTAAEGFDWAFCVPLRSESCPGWAIYMTGQFAAGSGAELERSIMEAPDELQDDVKFAELVGTTIANLRQSLRLERRQAAMRRFFAPVVMEALAGRDTDQVLSPREANLSVMFCDLRGFSRRSEQDSNQLLRLLEQVSQALGVMTGHILDTGGVIGDFHGDAAMGFWGWPLDQSDFALRAAEAAERILRTNHTRSGSDQFRCGIGIATGRAVAGRIGTVDQVKVTAFGPVVNLASRLEGMTKAFGAEIIVDQATAAALRSEQHAFRIRRLLNVRPAGMNSTIEACELVARTNDEARIVTDQQIADFEAAVESMIAGNWDRASDQLAALPSWDRPSQFLLDIINRHQRIPPPNWEGVIDVPKF